jgi:multiple sugar transport system ATP-binding protein
VGALSPIWVVFVFGTFTGGSPAGRLRGPVGPHGAAYSHARMGRVGFQGVSKRFGDVVAVDDLTLHIADQEFLVLLGPSGCGKSTALRMIAGLDEPTEGAVEIGGLDVTNVEAKDRDVAMVFQSYALYPHMSVRRNIEFPLRSRRVPPDERQRRVSEAAAILGLENLLDRKPAQLSGGQRQRVALARAIVRRPEAFLMDEPLSNLDAKLRVQTRAELVELHRRLATTIVYVTHDQVEAMTMGDRIAILNEGALQQVGAPQAVYEKPANLFVARFIGNPPMNTVMGTVLDGSGTVRAIGLPGGEIPVAPDVGAAIKRLGLAEVIVGVRAEHLKAGADGPIDATVSVIESLGHERHVFCRLTDGQPVIVRQPSDEPAPAEQAPTRLTVEKVELVHLFDPTTELRIEG